ncbi:hypothetical protein HB662_26365 [Roseomonas frigidaquae]|uniref:Uncharacterized protein n=1 Tax=Falsiroseomonas frigidaquae TaxID=487318 RepID=A0ABX1F7K5_9PROT|nr:hypothetical protein [Falsiroseomonas frigidaquae]NKE48327.1 hypothetical protein [Falsiroseomonas frigidaquae]
MRAIRLLVLCAAALPLAAAPAVAQQPPDPAPRAHFWFDPTQLPTFTGTVDRYLVNPAGETDALLFREGPQVVFPPDVAEAVRQAGPAGQRLIVWGIRARQAPVITMLAFAATQEAEPGVVDRFYWRLGGGPSEQSQRLAVSGTVRAPYFAPQGQVAGAVLEDGTVVLLPPGMAEPFADLLRGGARLAAEGRGFAGKAGRALVAERLGEAADALRPVLPESPPNGSPTPAPSAQPQR